MLYLVPLAPAHLNSYGTTAGGGRLRLSRLSQAMALGAVILLHSGLLLFALQPAVQVLSKPETAVRVTLTIEHAAPPPSPAVNEALDPIPLPTFVRPIRPAPIELLITPVRPHQPPHSIRPRARLPSRQPRDNVPVPQPGELATLGQIRQIPSPPVAAMALNSSAMLSALEMAIYQSVRSAAVMPEAAKRSHREGRVLVRFRYVDGIGSQATVVRSAGFRVLDDAALDAVRIAVYPGAPRDLRGHRLELAVWINFSLAPV